MPDIPVGAVHLAVVINYGQILISGLNLYISFDCFIITLGTATALLLNNNTTIGYQIIIAKYMATDY